MCVLSTKSVVLGSSVHIRRQVVQALADSDIAVAMARSARDLGVDAAKSSIELLASAVPGDVEAGAEDNRH